MAIWMIRYWAETSSFKYFKSADFILKVSHDFKMIKFEEHSKKKSLELFN